MITSIKLDRLLDVDQLNPLQEIYIRQLVSYKIVRYGSRPVLHHGAKHAQWPDGQFSLVASKEEVPLLKSIIYKTVMFNFIKRSLPNIKSKSL